MNETDLLTIRYVLDYVLNRDVIRMDAEQRTRAFNAREAVKAEIARKGRVAEAKSGRRPVLTSIWANL